MQTKLVLGKALPVSNSGKGPIFGSNHNPTTSVQNFVPCKILLISEKKEFDK